MISKDTTPILAVCTGSECRARGARVVLRELRAACQDRGVKVTGGRCSGVCGRGVTVCVLGTGPICEDARPGRVADVLDRSGPHRGD